MPPRLLATKFHIPPLRSAGISRPRLLERMSAGLQENRKLTLVSAPAGYGKTTLVTEWLHSLENGQRIAWLSLDEADNDPVRFLEYWIASLCSMDEAVGQSARSLLGVPQISSLTIILDELLNELAVLETRVCLVLDDYHVITTRAIHEAVEYFIDHQPPQIHLVFTTRVDPPLPLARLRARGHMTEIRAHDLRFTLDETRQFFNQTMCLDLSAEAVQTIATRTEGWAAGMQLAALALQNLPDQQDFLSDFGGSHRYVIDYLLEEVLKRQPLEIREFLVKTSVLRRFNAELCQAVTGNPAASEILAHLERSNLFLIPLDDTRGWYRYHHLFADAMRIGLESADERVIRASAAAWFESQGRLAEAVPHWLAVPDAGQAARLIAQLAPDLLRNGEVQTLLSWLNSLPEAVVDQNPDLVSHKVLCLVMAGHSNAAREFAARVYTTLPEQIQSSTAGHPLAIQAWFSATAGAANTVELSRAALERLDSGDLFFRALTLLALGSSYAWNDNLSESSQVFRQAWELGRRMKHPFIAMGALANLAFNLLEMGSLREAEALCRAALGEYVDNRGRQLPILGILHAPLAAICFEKGDFDEAQSLAERGISLCKHLFSNDIMGGDNEITLARIALARGEPEYAINLLREISLSASQRGMTVIVYKMALAEAELLLLQGNLPAAERKLNAVETLTQPEQSRLNRLAAHLRARLLAASGKAQPALAILQELEQTDLAGGAHRRLMSVHLTQALVYQRLGDQARARSLFEAVIQRAAAGGYRSLFFPHPGRDTRSLLEASRSSAPEFVESLLPLNPSLAESHSAPIEQLPDPLSEQERRVLKLIVAGKSNAEIAGELVISIGTAKWHVHNILRKLEVGNRPQAIARARELGI